jgi:hypothetical protein
VKPVLWIVLLGATILAASLVAVELTQLEGAAHAFPAMRELDGRKIADGEFTQAVRGNILHVEISYDFLDGGKLREITDLRQQPELSQLKWSCRQTKQGSLQREFEIDFGSGTAVGRERQKDGLKEWHEQVEIEPGQTFAGFGFVLALQNLRDRLHKGEIIELKAVGFTPKPRVVGVRLSYHGVDEMRMADRSVTGEHFMIQPQIPALAKMLIKVVDTNIWLTPPPSGFLRWEGPMVEPNDPVVRVDLASGRESGPARHVNTH